MIVIWQPIGEPGQRQRKTGCLVERLIYWLEYIFEARLESTFMMNFSEEMVEYIELTALPERKSKVQHFSVTPVGIAGVMLLQRQRLSDQRGYFERLFDADELHQAGWQGPVAQLNHTLTHQAGSLRGLHMQVAPFAEYKLVTCLRGRVWDVAVDLRAGSPTFKQSFAVVLAAEQQNALLIPPGCAHGFQTLCDEVEMLYCHSQPYQAEAELCVQACDPGLGLDWPLAITERSDKDLFSAELSADFAGVVL